MGRCAGIDPSLCNTGVVILEGDCILHMQSVKTKPAQFAPTIRGELERILHIVDTVAALCAEHKVDTVAIEGLAFMARNTTALVQLSALNYFLRERLIIDMGLTTYIVAPSTLKKFVTGKGNVKKDVMFMETFKRYGETFTDDNLCDAHGLGRMARACQDEEAKLPVHQQEAVKVIKQK